MPHNARPDAHSGLRHANFPVAAAILDWGLAEGATNFSHVFQPLGAIGVRHGCTGQLHNQLFTFGADGKPEYKFKAEQLLRGETDGSSYPNGGLRSKLI
jgi:glutamine synthetase